MSASSSLGEEATQQSNQREAQGNRIRSVENLDSGFTKDLTRVNELENRISTNSMILRDFQPGSQLST
jgi:hypothetical protein